MPSIAPPDRPLVIGHRGAMAVRPENTLASFREGIAQGADGLECDVHLTRDGQVVVLHDFTLDRTTTGHGPVGDRTLAELSDLDAGSWYDPRYAGEPLPTLDQYLELIVEGSRDRAYPLWAFIELKAGSCRYPGIEQAVVAAVRRAGWKQHTVLISFDHLAVQETKRLEPAVATGVLYHARPVEAPDLARSAGSDFLCPGLDMVGAREAEQARAAGLKTFVWTVNTEAEARRMAELGIDAFGANAPGLARQALGPLG